MFNKKILVLFLILIAGYSCTAKKKLGPKPVEFELRASLDFYGSPTPKDPLVQMVGISFKDSNGKLLEYNENDLLKEDAIIVPKDAEVTINLYPTDTEYGVTFIGGNIDYEHDVFLKNYTFKMDENKYFEIVFGRYGISSFRLDIEAGDNGKVEISKMNNDTSTLETTTVLPGKIKPLAMTRATFEKHSVSIKAIANNGYTFNGWDGASKAGDAWDGMKEAEESVVVSYSGMRDKIVKANFRAGSLDDTKNFNFKATGNGRIVVTIKKGSDVETIEVRNKTETVAIPMRRFVDSSVQAEMIPDSGYYFLAWSGGYSGRKNPLAITAAMAETTMIAEFLRDFSSSEPTETDGDWILISEPAHLRWLAENVNNANYDTTGKKYKLKNDIDYRFATHIPMGFDADVPVNHRYFQGVLDGNGYSIKNAIFASSRYSASSTTPKSRGFIGNLGVSGIISNLTIDKSVVIRSETRDFQNPDYATSAGGIAANSLGAIYNCVNKADIYTMGGFAGGIVGTGSGANFIISNVYNSGNITIENPNSSPPAVGGIVGIFYANVNSKLFNAYNTGDVTLNVSASFSSANPFSVGGVIGSMYLTTYPTIKNVYSTGNLYSKKGTETSIKYTGGVFGYINSGSTLTITLDESMYFINKNSLSTKGYGSLESKLTVVNDNIDRSITDSTTGWNKVFNSFKANTEGLGAWRQVSGGRPVLVGIGE